MKSIVKPNRKSVLKRIIAGGLILLYLKVRYGRIHLQSLLLRRSASSRPAQAKLARPYL